ncbi:MAG: hypothetical protein ABI164_02375, partial [Acidobacteriaceae bacterium]
MNTTVILAMAVIAIFALLAGWWLGRSSARAAAQPLAESLRESRVLTERLLREKDLLLAERAGFEAQAMVLRRQCEEQTAELGNLRSQCAQLTTEAARVAEQLKAGNAALASERELLTAAREKLTDTFKSLAGDILKENNAQFLGLANRELSAKEESIEKILSPVRETLGKMEAQTQRLETERGKAYTEV